MRDAREEFERDRDRILYTSAFQRLAEVTQVVSSDEGHVFHNRLTHSLKVAQVARRIAERLMSEHRELAMKGQLSADVAEAAALAHDLGHPPFGHLAEEELDRAVVDAGVPDGYEGNAQSFRILTKLALKSTQYQGLNLTRATLDAVLKYPWLRASGGKEYKKWGAYHTELGDFAWARDLHPSGATSRSTEAEIMDWADDLTYAVHDVADFYAAGRIPLERLSSLKDDRERKVFLDATFARPNNGLAEFNPQDVLKSFESLIQYLSFPSHYQGKYLERAGLRAACSYLIGIYVNSVGLESDGDNVAVTIDPQARMRVAILKELTWYYIILDSRLITQQHGQRRLIRKLFWIFHDASRKSQLQLFPAPYLERLQSNAEPRSRVIADYIASMTERQASRLYLRLTGIVPGSALH